MGHDKGETKEVLFSSWKCISHEIVHTFDVMRGRVKSSIIVEHIEW